MPTLAIGVGAYLVKLAVGGFLLALFETAIAKMRVFRVPEFLGAALMLGLLGDAAAVRVGELLMRRHRLRHRPSARRLAGADQLPELYQDRLYALLNVYALHALVLAASVAWQAFVQDAPHLYVTAAIALVFKAIVIPVALHRMIVRLGIHREIEKVVGRRSRHARRHRAGRAVDGGDAARDARRPIRWRARISPSRCRSFCSAC